MQRLSQLSHFKSGCSGPAKRKEKEIERMSGKDIGSGKGHVEASVQVRGPDMLAEGQKFWLETPRG